MPVDESFYYAILPTEEEYYDDLWSKVNTALIKGISKGILTYIWASAQILRHAWIPPKMKFIMEKLRREKW